jgi:hypothetical protein
MLKAMLCGVTIMPKPCPKCLGSGLASAGIGAGVWMIPTTHTAKCVVCNGRGWLPDVSEQEEN